MIYTNELREIYANESMAQSNDLQKQILVFLMRQKPIGSILSKADVFDYLIMLNDVNAYKLMTSIRNYRIGLNNEYDGMKLENIKEFVLMEIETDKLPIIEFSTNKTEVPKEYLEKMENYKAITVQTGAYPPLIYDEEERRILDGNHRAHALKELGFKEITVLKAIKYNV